ncbi:hypothetical protein CAEBREN_19584 [Caenorhabditis brenneri]|uniref:Uncharacterized protein n=1 Tax=Caenorhabditis brenneri TaxID=135651 RepID=G0N6E3_CAEBE|nr:hypothetical protein CAEBREN_19584 [Caenorhabditis brenneri]
MKARTVKLNQFHKGF